MENNSVNIENLNDLNISDSEIKVSVIIPVYKVRPYIERCLDVMQNQTLREIEIIFVDDCGGDDAIKVVEERAQTDSRIKILYNECNSGAGPSRNRGIDIARGKYLGFIDADDSIDLNYYEVLYNLAEKHQCEVVKASCITVYDDRQATSNMYKLFKDFPECSERNDWQDLFTFEHWCAIYRADFVREHGSRYGNTSTGQDAVFLLTTMYYARRVAFTYDTNYYYYKHAGSLDTTRSKEFFLAKMQVYRDFINFFNANDTDARANCTTLAGRFDTTVGGYYKSLMKIYSEDEDFQLEVLKRLNDAIREYKHSDMLYKAISQNELWKKAIKYMETGELEKAHEYLVEELMRVSVIVPIYDVGSLTKRCIDRILTNFYELICIDMVQTDESNTYFSSLTTAYPSNQIRIRNGNIDESIGKQMNSALDASGGRYVLFLSPRDYLKQGALKKLFETALKDDLDIAVAKSIIVEDAENDDLSKAPRIPKNSVKGVINFYNDHDKFTDIDIPLCGVLFKRRFLTENNIGFSEHRNFSERLLWADALVKARRIAIADIDLVVHTIYDFDKQSETRNDFAEDLVRSYKLIAENAAKAPDKFEVRILERELNYVAGILYKFKYKANFERTYEKIKEFFSNLDVEHLEGLYNLTGGAIDEKAWYAEYSDILALDGGRYAAAHKIKFDAEYEDYQLDEDIKISIIIPVYNMENHIGECIESIIYQTLTEFEIICVDDCSTDNSLEVLRSLSETDPRIKVIAQPENMSASQARKDGVAAAHGKYIMFIDADDALRPSALETLYNEMESRPVDILHFGTEIINEGDLPADRIENMKKFVKPFKGSFSGFDVFEQCFITSKYRFSLWNKFYNAKLCKYAFSHIKDGSFPKAQDLYAYFVIAFFAKSYRGISDNIFYEYHFGRGITGHNLLTLSQFEIYCQMGLVADAAKDFLAEQKYDKVFEEALNKVRAGLESDCVSQWNNNLADEDKLAGYELMVKYFPAPEIIARVIRLYPDDQGKIAKMLAGSHTLDVKKTEIRTVGIHYFRLDTGGIQRVISLLSALYIKMGYDVVVFADEPIEQDVFGLPEETKIVQLHGINRDYSKLGGYLAEFSGQLLENNIDILVGHTWIDSYGLLARILTVKSLGIPFVVHCHNVFTVPMIDTKSFYSDMPYIYALCDGIAALSNTDKEYWQQFNDRVTTIANPFTYDLTSVQPAPLQEKSVIWPARVAGEKRPADPIEIFKLVTQKIPDAKLYYIGDAKNEAEMNRLKDKINNMGLSENIIVTGFVTNIEDYYQKSSVFLCTSIYEGWLMTLFEGQSFGLPTVMYEMPWLPLVEGNNGIIAVPQGSKQKAADAIVELLNNEELRLEMGKKARENVERFAGFDYEGVWQSIFDKALKSDGIKQVPDYQALMFDTFNSHFKFHISKMKKLRKPTDKIVVSPTEQLTEKEMIKKLEWFRTALSAAQNGKKIPEPNYAAYESNEIKMLKNELQKCKADLKKKSDDCSKLLADANFYRSELDGTRSSLSFRLARLITWLPRKLRELLKK